MSSENNEEKFDGIRNCIIVDRVVDGYSWLIVKRGPLTVIFTDFRNPVVIDKGRLLNFSYDVPMGS
jgi:hypothetical protein